MSDSKTPRRRATYDDVLRAPKHVVAELIDGVLYTSPRPASRHGRAEIVLSSRLFQHFDPEQGTLGGWWIMREPELHFGEDVLVPDLGGWRREHMLEYPDVKAFTLAPDWVCEVLSPSTKRLDRTKKLAVYASEGVMHVWFVDPLAKTLEVMNLRGRRLILDETYKDGDLIRAVPFDVIEIPLNDLWLKTATRTASARTGRTKR